MFFKGTNECTHKMHEYNNESYHHIKVPLTGKPNQPSSSPRGMAPYKNAPPNKELGDYFNIHTDIKGIEEPDATGKRNDGYVRVLQVNYMFDCIQGTFSCDDTYYDDCPGIGADKNPLKELSNICKSDVGRLLFNPRRIVLFWPKLVRLWALVGLRVGLGLACRVVWR